MNATSYQLGQVPSAEPTRRRRSAAEDEFAPARRRLTLAALWLAGLVGWGVFSYVTEPPDGARSDVRASVGQTFDGRGKWIGY